MTRRIYALILIVTFALGTLACDGNGDDEELEPVGNYEAVPGLDDSAEDEGDEQDDDAQQEAVDAVLDD